MCIRDSTHTRLLGHAQLDGWTESGLPGGSTSCVTIRAKGANRRNCSSGLHCVGLHDDSTLNTQLTVSLPRKLVLLMLSLPRRLSIPSKKSLDPFQEDSIPFKQSLDPFQEESRTHEKPIRQVHFLEHCVDRLLMHTCLCVFVCACVRACVRACVCVCVFTAAKAFEKGTNRVL